MANYRCKCRTNYFLVKDLEKFETWASRYPVKVIRKMMPSNELMVGLLGTDPDEGGWPVYDPETDEDIDFPNELSKHLRKGSIAVLMTVGSEKLVYLDSTATAIDHTGRCCLIDINDIYQKAAMFFGTPVSGITRAIC